MVGQLEALISEVSELNQEGISISMDSSIPQRYEKSVALFNEAITLSMDVLPSWELYSFVNLAYSRRQLGHNPLEVARTIEVIMSSLSANNPDNFSVGRAYEEMAVARRSAEPNLLVYQRGISDIEKAISNYEEALKKGWQIVSEKRMKDQKLRAYGLAAMLNLITGKMLEGDEREDYFHDALRYAHSELEARSSGPKNYNYMNSHHIIGVIHSEMMLTREDDKDYHYTMASRMIQTAQALNSGLQNTNKNVSAVLNFRLAKLKFDYNPQDSDYRIHLDGFLNNLDDVNPIVINEFKQDLLKINEVVKDDRITQLYQ